MNKPAQAIQLPMPVIDLIPHDQPMALLDNVIQCSDSGVTTTVTIRKDSTFANADGVPACVGIEYMGQAIAAHAGLIARRSGEAVKIGFLVSVRRYEPGIEYFPIGTTLQVKVTAVTEFNAGLNVFACEINGVVNDTDLHIDANLNVFMPDNTDQFMQGSH